MPAGVIGWRTSEDPEVRAARYAIAGPMTTVLAVFFAEVVNAHIGDDEEPLSVHGQEYRVVEDDAMCFNRDDFTLTICMGPGPDGCHERRAGWYKQELGQKLLLWLRERPTFAKAGLKTIQVDLRFIPMSGYVLDVNDGSVVTTWGDAGWGPKAVSISPAP